MRKLLEKYEGVMAVLDLSDNMINLGKYKNYKKQIEAI